MCRLGYLVSIHKIPTACVVNFDQTGIHLVPTGGGRTFAEKGAKAVTLIGQDDKRQITGKRCVAGASALACSTNVGNLRVHQHFVSLPNFSKDDVNL